MPRIHTDSVRHSSTPSVVTTTTTTRSPDLHQLGLVRLACSNSSDMFPEHNYNVHASNDKRQVVQLRQLLFSQLDLIQKQSDAIVNKDQQLLKLKRENDRLQLRLATMEDRMEAATQAAVKAKAKAAAKFAKNQPEEEDFVMEIMETSEPYFILQSLGPLAEEKNETKGGGAEVPGWRLLPMSPSYTMEGTENIEDETLLKRHQRPEVDEKRRKRWDVQRLREQRHVQRLRARYDPQNEAIMDTLNNGVVVKMKPKYSSKPSQLSNVDIPAALPSSCENGKPALVTGGKSTSTNKLAEGDLPTSLLPFPDEATHINVTDKLPVSAFGFPLPQMAPQDFKLPPSTLL